MGKREFVAGLDIGTTKVCSIIAEILENGELQYRGSGISNSSGMRRGNVSDVQLTAKAIESAMDQAMDEARHDVLSVFVSISGDSISCLNNSSVIPIKSPQREITDTDVEIVTEQAGNVVLPPDRRILHVIPRYFSVDGNTHIQQPVGISGTRLAVETHIVHCPQTCLQNIEKCIEHTDLEMMEPVLSSLASAETVLEETDRYAGVCVVDIGGGTTDIAVFHEGQILYSAVVPIGGEMVTNDIVEVLKISRSEAERLKHEYGCEPLTEEQEQQSIVMKELGVDGSNQVLYVYFSQIVSARIEELFEMVKTKLEAGNCLDKMPFGVVITGGGSQLKGCAEVASNILGIPVRKGKIKPLKGMKTEHQHPRYATVLGIVNFGAKRLQHNNLADTFHTRRTSHKKGFWRRILELLGF